METRLRKAYADFRGWKSRNKIRSSQPRFTAARVHRNHRTEFPSMSSKAIAGKTLSFWLAEVACEEAAKPSATQLTKLVASCAWTYVENRKLAPTFDCRTSGKLF